MQGALRRAGIESRFLEVDGIRLHYVAGPPRDEALVLVPGQSMSWESYHRVLPRLSRRFEVYAVDVRGHGQSARTPGKYTFDRMGRDLEVLVRQVVRRPVVASGNSSGGLIALWLAANAPDMVRGVVPEDPPLFSAEWPRIRDCFVYGFMRDVVDALGGPEPDLAGCIGRLRIPVEGSERIMNFPRPLAVVLGALIRVHQRLRPGRPVDLPGLPAAVRVWIKSLSSFDPEFARAFLDGYAAQSLDHAAMLSKVRCPMLLLHANWFVHPKLGLCGAMEDRDVERALSLVPGSKSVRVRQGHTIHLEAPALFVQHVNAFADSLRDSGATRHAAAV